MEEQRENKRQEAVDIVQACRNKLYALKTCFQAISCDETEIKEPILFGAGMEEIFSDMASQLTEACCLIEKI